MNKKELIQKLSRLTVSLTLVFFVGFYLTTAWFTRMTEVGNIKLDVARWEFRANEQVDNFIADVFSYSNVKEKKAAPGTVGYIDLEMSALGSDVNVQFHIKLAKDQMDQEFKERIHFYFYEDSDINGYTYDQVSTKTSKVPRTYFINDDVSYIGEITFNTTRTVRIFWEWIYELDLNTDDDGNYISNENGVMISSRGYALDEEGREVITSQPTITKLLPEKVDLNNEFDTIVGKNPVTYSSRMSAVVKITGKQVTPIQTSPKP